MGLTLEDVRSVLTNATTDSPKGALDGDRQSFAVYDNDQLTRAADYDRRHHRLPQRRGGARAPTSAARSTRPRTTSGSAGRSGKRKSIILLVIQAAGRQRHRHGGRGQGRAAAPRGLDPAHRVHIHVVSDRTLTIRASVRDVQFTLMLSIALVVMVIFIFLRSAWATIIPSVTVPVALICTFAVMYLLASASTTCR